MVLSTHGGESLHNVSQYKTNSDQCAFAADKHHSGKHQQKDSRNEETVGQNLNVFANVIGEKSSYAKHGNCDQRSDTETNDIFDQ